MLSKFPEYLLRNYVESGYGLGCITPDGKTEWTTFQHVHADGEGSMVAQPRVFAGESSPDGFGGVLAAWTYLSPDSSGGVIRSEARLSRIGPSGQRDFTLPMPYWTKGLNSFFDENMVLGDGNILYAINGPQLLRFDTQAGETNWVRHPPTGEVKLDHSTAGGGCGGSLTPLNGIKSRASIRGNRGHDQKCLEPRHRLDGPAHSAGGKFVAGYNGNDGGGGLIVGRCGENGSTCLFSFQDDLSVFFLQISNWRVDRPVHVRDWPPGFIYCRERTFVTDEQNDGAGRYQ
jgi:hypothetical protein